MVLFAVQYGACRMVTENFPAPGIPGFVPEKALLQRMNGSERCTETEFSTQLSGLLCVAVAHA